MQKSFGDILCENFTQIQNPYAASAICGTLLPYLKSMFLLTRGNDSFKKRSAIDNDNHQTVQGARERFLFLNTSYLTDSYIIFTLKMESVSKNTIFDLKMIVKSGLEIFF